MNSRCTNRVSARYYAACTVIATMLLCVSISPAFGQERPSNGPQTYELRCRGGGLRFNSTPLRPGRGERIRKVTIDFAAGTQGVRAPEDLKPGQCSWVDRGFRQGEPAQIRLQAGVVEAARMQKILGSAERYWSFAVYNTNRGYLQGTRDYEWAPAR